MLNLSILLINKSENNVFKYIGSLIERIELITIDWRYQYKASLSERGKYENYLIPLMMDRKSDKALAHKWGMHPYNRKLYSRIVDFMDRHDACIIAFDMVFELDHDGTKEFCKSLKSFKGDSVGAITVNPVLFYDSINDFKKQNQKRNYLKNNINKSINESFSGVGCITLVEMKKNNPDEIIRQVELLIPSEDNDGKGYKYLGAELAERYFKKMSALSDTSDKKEFYKKRLDYLKSSFKQKKVYLDIFFTGRTVFHDMKCMSMVDIIAEDANERGIIALKEGKYQIAEDYFRESLRYLMLVENPDFNIMEVKNGIAKDWNIFLEEIKENNFTLQDLKIPENPEEDNRPFSMNEQLLGIYLSQNFTESKYNLNIDEFLKIQDHDEMDMFKNKNYILAPWSVIYKDMYQCPAGKIRGVELHTTVFQNIMEMSFCKRFDTDFGIMLNFMIGIVVAIGMYLTGILRSMVLSLLSSLVFIAAVFFGIVWVFLEWGVFLEITPFFFQSFMTVVLLSTVKYIFEYREQKKVKNILGKYVSPDLARELIKNPESLKLGGHEIEGSVIFMDVCSFTSMSEKLEAVEVISLLNRYFEKINRIIFDTGGMLDKFIGDAVMAIYGVFSDNDEHARNAIKACLDIKESIQDIDAEPALKFSFGINTGEMVCGNLGSSLRQDFTAIGDTVNTAARLEGLAIVNEICVGNNTYEFAKDYFEFEGPFFQKVKGKEKEVKFYKVTGYKK